MGGACQNASSYDFLFKMPEINHLILHGVFFTPYFSRMPSLVNLFLIRNVRNVAEDCGETRDLTRVRVVRRGSDEHVWRVFYRVTGSTAGCDDSHATVTVVGTGQRALGILEDLMR